MFKEAQVSESESDVNEHSQELNNTIPKELIARSVITDILFMNYILL